MWYARTPKTKVFCRLCGETMFDLCCSVVALQFVCCCLLLAYFCALIQHGLMSRPNQSVERPPPPPQHTLQTPHDTAACPADSTADFWRSRIALGCETCARPTAAPKRSRGRGQTRPSGPLRARTRRRERAAKCAIIRDTPRLARRACAEVQTGRGGGGGAPGALPARAREPPDKEL